MSPAFHIILGVFFLAGGGFVVAQGLRARKASIGPFPKFFVFAFAVHAVIALLGVFLIAKGALALVGA